MFNRKLYSFILFGAIALEFIVFAAAGTGNKPGINNPDLGLKSLVEKPVISNSPIKPVPQSLGKYEDMEAVAGSVPKSARLPSQERLTQLHYTKTMNPTYPDYYVPEDDHSAKQPATGIISDSPIHPVQETVEEIEERIRRLGLQEDLIEGDPNKWQRPAARQTLPSNLGKKSKLPNGMRRVNAADPLNQPKKRFSIKTRGNQGAADANDETAPINTDHVSFTIGDSKKPTNSLKRSASAFANDAKNQLMSNLLNLQKGRKGKGTANQQQDDLDRMYLSGPSNYYEGASDSSSSDSEAAQPSTSKGQAGKAQPSASKGQAGTAQPSASNRQAGKGKSQLRTTEVSVEESSSVNVGCCNIKNVINFKKSSKHTEKNLQQKKK